LGLLGGLITNLRGSMGAFRASSGPLESPIRALRGAHHDAWRAPSGPLGDLIRAFRGPIRDPSGSSGGPNGTFRAPLEVP
jgi:hypothetical protein